MKKPYEPAKAELLLAAEELLNADVALSGDNDGSTDLPEDEFLF